MIAVITRQGATIIDVMLWVLCYKKGTHQRPSFETAVALAVSAALHLCQSPCLFLL